MVSHKTEKYLGISQVTSISELFIERE